MKILQIILLMVCATASAQNIKTQPKDGKGAVQIVYYRIDFSKEETEYLRTHTPELIFSVSKDGVATLERVNGITMQSIVDSLVNVNDKLPEFFPETVNGVAQAGVYFLKLTWPNYNSTSMISFPIQFYAPVVRKLSDFESITYRYPRYDMAIGFFGATSTGNIRSTMGNGWGSKFDLMLYGKKGWGGGLITTFIFGKGDSHDPSIPVRYQTNSNMMSLVGGAFGKLFRESKAGQFSVQLEPSFGIVSVMNRNASGFDRGVALGFSPGASASYLLKLGQGRVARQYFFPVAYKHYLNFHVAARQLMFNNVSARGNIFEFGVSYRLATQGVIDYKLKE